MGKRVKRKMLARGISARTFLVRSGKASGLFALQAGGVNHKTWPPQGKKRRMKILKPSVDFINKKLLVSITT